ncbi:hypothetical protein [Rhodoferax aquaticus]|uniref:Outer membrane protein beta-barrel domain-containing protein n=1 Tax=Rhodoferax aquaticus TaxID=2527691 RepID=A0A515ETY0_9BURK|nr:hypothetical protein [Rhodoferax aquaticus]QDL56140.1 hypothetical protein EXZ61_19335 [Rhodoferax aquaticus]
MANKKAWIPLVLALAVLPGVATAGDAGTLYTQVGLNGVGLGYAASLTNDWALRGQINAYKQSFSGDVGDFGANSRLNVDLSLSSFQLVGDWYPSEGGFRLSGGLVVNDNKVSINGTNATVGSTSGLTVNSEIKLSDSPSPYVGLGYSTRPKDAKGFGFNFDLGVMFQDPKVSLTATGASASDIATQKAKVQDAVNKLKTMPVIGLGVSYSF